jgi:hypothetical protein
VLAAVLAGASPLAANLDKLAQRCSAGEQKACSELALLATTHKDASVRAAAVARIEDQPTLESIARNVRQEPLVRKAAVERLTDQGVLIEIAKNALYANVWWAALSRVAAPDTRASIAEARLPKIKTRDGVKRGILQGRLLLCKPAAEPGGLPVRRVPIGWRRMCLVVDGSYVAEIADSGVRFLSSGPALLLASVAGDESNLGDMTVAALDLVDKAALDLVDKKMAGGTGSVGLTTVTWGRMELFVVQRWEWAGEVKLLGELDQDQRRLNLFVRVATLGGEDTIPVDQLAQPQ